MRSFPEGGLIGKTVRLAREISGLRIRQHAANAGYFIVLSLFPALLLLLGLLRYTALDVESLTVLLEGVLPGALLPVAQALIDSAWAHSSGAAVGISAVTALWSASRGMYAILTGLNAIYGLEEERGYLYTRFISVLYLFLFLLVLLLTLVLHVFGTTLLSLLPKSQSPLLIFLYQAVDLRLIFLIFLQTLLFDLMFVALPSRRNGFRESLPGALLASAGWVTFSGLYSVYVERFARLTDVYGSVYAVTLSMLWLYCCLSIVFYGGALNRWLAGRNKR